MDKKAEKIIEALIEMRSGNKCICALADIWKENADITISQLSQETDIPESQIRSIITYLGENGYIEYVYFRIKTSEPERIAFFLSHKGMAYQELKNQKVEMEKKKEEEISIFRKIAESAQAQASSAEEQVKTIKCQIEKINQQAKEERRKAWGAMIVSIISALAAVTSAVIAFLALNQKPQ